ncbi:MAG: hypothetical protein HFH86_01890 [Bacilli bacterium]|nr:hypothetical protein [Bacilli bacterium]
MNIININEIEEQYQELILANQQLKNEMISPFLQSYLNRCIDPQVERMAKKIKTKLNEMEKSYLALTAWLNNYLMSTKGVENVISQNGSKEITEGAILESVFHQFEELKSLTIHLKDTLNPSTLGNVKDTNDSSPKNPSTTPDSYNNSAKDSNNTADFESGFTMEGYQFDYEKMLESLGKFDLDFQLNYDFDNLKNLDLKLSNNLENLTNSKIEINTIGSNIIDKIDISTWNLPSLEMDVIKGNVASISGLISGLLNIGILKIPNWLSTPNKNNWDSKDLAKILSLSNLSLEDIKNHIKSNSFDVKQAINWTQKDFNYHNSINNSFQLSTSSKIGIGNSILSNWHELENQQVANQDKLASLNLNESILNQEQIDISQENNNTLKTIAQSGIGTSLLLGCFMALSGKLMETKEIDELKTAHNATQTKIESMKKEKFTSLIRIPLMMGNNYQISSTNHKNGFCFFDYQKAMELLTQGSKISNQKNVYVYPQ